MSSGNSHLIALQEEKRALQLELQGLDVNRRGEQFIVRQMKWFWKSMWLLNVIFYTAKWQHTSQASFVISNTFSQPMKNHHFHFHLVIDALSLMSMEIRAWGCVCGGGGQSSINVSAAKPARIWKFKRPAKAGESWAQMLIIKYVGFWLSGEVGREIRDVKKFCVCVKGTYSTHTFNM